MKVLFYVFYGCNLLLLLLGNFLLPPEVAVHFSLSGEPDQWMMREIFLLAWALYCTLMALLFGLIASGNIPLASRFCNLPSKNYWLAPSRVEKAQDMFSKFLYQGGFGLFLFLGVLFLLLLYSHVTEPPHLSLYLFLPLLGIFLQALLLWILRFYQAFRPPKTDTEE